jgi:hypothetical protein
MKQIRKFAVAGLVLISLGLILYPVIRVHLLESSFSKVKENDSRDYVLKQMGIPWKDEECGVYLGGKPSGCVEEFYYAHPYAPYVPEYWVIDFNSSQRVIQSTHLVSP